MIAILPSPDHVVAIKASGTLTGDDYDRVIAELERKLARHDRIGVLADLVDFKDLTAEAALKDLRYDLKALFQLKRFPREAVITDARWIRVLAQIASPVVPHVEIRAFASDQTQAAMDWVSAVGGNPADRVRVR